MDNRSPHVVVLGAGFGGISFCQSFHYPSARITVVDPSNHHLFQPLLYQVATTGLSAPEIAQPVRSILSDKPNITVLLDEAQDVNLADKRVRLGKGALTYDYLVLALGAVTSYFGHPEWEQFAPGLKSLSDAIRIRGNVLLGFERAEMESDPQEQARLMTIVIVGGGPTGIELAGAFAELARVVLKRDFRRIDPGKARIILIEASPRLLSNLPADLSESAKRQLERLGVQVRTNARVKSITAGCVQLNEGETIHAENIIWAAGVSACPLTQKLGVELDRAGRVKVNLDLSLPGHPEVFAIGDMALVLGSDGTPVPGVAPAAMQMAKHTARIIQDELNYPETATRSSFKYLDKGTMATIGRTAAVAQVRNIHISGLVAWVAWLGIHLIFLIGLRNKLAVMLQWMYSYFAYKRGARIITSASSEKRTSP